MVISFAMVAYVRKTTLLQVVPPLKTGRFTKLILFFFQPFTNKYFHKLSKQKALMNCEIIQLLEKEKEEV